jgi:uncharacterized membrane protein
MEPHDQRQTTEAMTDTGGNRAEAGKMSETMRMILIALGIALLVVVLVPALFMTGMMASVMGGGMMEGGGAWITGVLVLLVLVAGVALVAIGVGGRR